MENSNAGTYLEALGKAQKYTPDTQATRELVLRLVNRGLCVAPNAKGWLKVKCPTTDMVFQLELGKPGDENTLVVTALNEKIPAGEIFPLYSTKYDQIIMPLESDYYTIEDVVYEIGVFIVEHAPEAEAILSTSVPKRIPTKG